GGGRAGARPGGRAPAPPPAGALRPLRWLRCRRRGGGPDGGTARVEPRGRPRRRARLRRGRPRGPAPVALNVARESRAARTTRARAIARGLARAYPDAWRELDYQNPWQLVVATVLSAQCTDKM